MLYSQKQTNNPNYLSYIFDIKLNILQTHSYWKKLPYSSSFVAAFKSDFQQLGSLQPPNPLPRTNIIFFNNFQLKVFTIIFATDRHTIRQHIDKITVLSEF